MSATATKLNIKPLEDRVLIEVEEEAEQTSGGIFLPDTAREKPQRGTILAVGPGKTLDNGQVKSMSVKVGDRVMFQKYGGTDIKFEGQDYKILSERDLLGILD